MVVMTPYDLSDAAWVGCSRQVQRKMELAHRECLAHPEGMESVAGIGANSDGPHLRLQRRLGASTERWEQSLYEHACILSRHYVSEALGLAGLGATARKDQKSPSAWMLAALRYVCNPDDIIPDCAIATGFVDDAIAVNLALDRIKQLAPPLHRRIAHDVLRAAASAGYPPTNPDEYKWMTGIRFRRSSSQTSLPRQRAFACHLQSILEVSY